ncbi:xylitol oxidase [Motilibacter rhizosphaerae]|uniref:Xylitol oxidase n=1 Tax=Motilibacter rhizosphaerae TaxID=598652 RepID=A0A4Q7NWV2_9ACTN|nr:FAD-binding protein [Motilibacter rhizosphaerae]RZS91813.1 xylitol oxidase [Motilibacter rhizosphaerae]
MSERLTNWAGNVVFEPERYVRPTSVEQLQEVVAAAPVVRVLGSGHSFNTVADTTGLLVNVEDLPREVSVDAAAGTARVSAGARFGDLFAPLAEAGVALHNTGSLPHISVAGACATGTHGSGNALGNLASAVVGLELVAPDGTLRTVRAGDADFAGSVISLGLLGVVTAMALRVQPAYEIRQFVYDDVPFASYVEAFDEAHSSAYSVSGFLTWRSDHMHTIWRKQLVDAPAGPAEWLGGRLADGERHPIPGIPGEVCTPQQGVPGPWHARLPHFRMEFTPSAGDEIQTEYLLPYEDAVPALQALSAVRDRIGPAVQISEIRTIDGDEQWLSTAHGRRSVALHFTWVSDWSVTEPAVRAVEEALEPFPARPHWGKVFTMERDRVRAQYPRLGEFEELVGRSDPTGKFANEFVRRYFSF